MKTTLKYFVHGTTYDNASKKCSGWKQVQLTDLGKEQAANLGKINSDIKFDVIFTSDLIRAIDSANIAFPNVEKIQDERLRECNYGDLDGMDKNLIVYEDHIDEPFPNGESLKDVEQRIRSFIDDIKKEYQGKTIGIVAHRAPQLAFEVITKNISWEEANKNDWRKTGDWQPGWEYTIKM
ncbi:MAG: histidine phosphatase family protein [Bacilli bacterium]|nr:histidine phosphatase family protein [Bacilli bacterium]